MKISPGIWGPKLWQMMHLIAFTYPENPTEQNKIDYYNFFASIQFIIPCLECKEHYINNLLKYPLKDLAGTSYNQVIFYNNANLLNWTINMHNEVNIMRNNSIPNNSLPPSIYTYNVVYNLLAENNKIAANPTKWGPGFWTLLHIIGYSKTLSDEADIKESSYFFTSLGNVLPCVVCRTNYKDYMTRNPLSSDVNLFTWTVNMHNFINNIINKNARYNITINDILNVYYNSQPETFQSIASHKHKRNNTTLVCIIFIILIIILLVVIYNKTHYNFIYLDLNSSILSKYF